MMAIWPEGGGIPANEEELHGQQQEGLRGALRGREELLPRAVDLRRRVSGQGRHACVVAKPILPLSTEYRVTIPLVQNLRLTSRQKFRFGLARPGQTRPKRNFSLEGNRRFCTS